MSEQQSMLTYEGILEMFHETKLMFQELGQKQMETDRQIKEMTRETDQKFRESAEQLKAAQREVGKLGSRIGEIVESMVKGNIVAKFQALDYDITECSQNRSFEYKNWEYAAKSICFWTTAMLPS